METTTHKAAAPVVVSTSKRSIVARVRMALASATVGLGFLIGGGIASASATPDPTDPLAGSGDSLFTSLKDYLTGHLVPAVVGLIVVAIAVTMLVKWGSKAAKKA